MISIGARRRVGRLPMKGSARMYSGNLPLFDTPFPWAEECRDPLLELSVARVDGLSSREKLRLWQAIGSVGQLESLSRLDAESIVLRRIEGERWNPKGAVKAARLDMAWLAPRGIRFIPLLSPSYPPQLRESYRPPFGLFVWGRLPDPNVPAVAVVGTRAPTMAGIEAAQDLASGLAARGICVVSGLARGIDSAAHRGALSARGPTLAVLPAGMDDVYPRSNRGLAASIIQSGGCLIAEHHPGTDMQKYRFPERNRIIAALCRSCVVVQAPRRSGALITAEHALSEGRDVFVHSACLGGARNEGADGLAEQGARILADAQDLVDEWTVRETACYASDRARSGEEETLWRR
ncbi:MAG TPA: DNA-processing protein DprA [Rectinemataceae bacterium]